MKHLKLVLVFLLAFTAVAEAQDLTISADIKPRYEYRHGFNTLAPKNANPAQFVSQRTRFISFYKSDLVNVKIAVQNVRVWGDVPTLNKSDKYIKFHEAWAEFPVKDKIYLKLGRQEIVYDNHRFFGNVEWTQQARSHDAALIKFLPNDKHRLDVGFALNADNEDMFETFYSNIAGYKTMQYVWYHGKFLDDALNLSFYAVNTGIQYQDTTNNTLWIDNMQTVGPLFVYKKNALKLEGWAFYQTGKRNKANVGAYDVSLNAYYTIKERFTIGAGGELLSGKAMNDTTADVKSFAPLFGTNHKFNGWMDQFYVNNHFGSVGLTDLYLILQYQKDKFTAKLIPHMFSSAADIYKGTQKMDSNLGTEFDFMIAYKINKSVTMQAGYSHLLPTESLEVLKGGSYQETQNWAWLMFVIRPTLLKTTLKK